MRNLIWNLIAKVVSHPKVAPLIIARAKKTPYFHIKGPDGSMYMERYWLFNQYEGRSGGPGARFSWLPSIRVHKIMRADLDRHLHDHPWNARTIILQGWYAEELPSPTTNYTYSEARRGLVAIEERDGKVYKTYLHNEGFTGRLLYGQYHRIAFVPEEGVYTLFFTWKYKGTWGYDVDGSKVPWREYLESRKMPIPGGDS